MENIAIQLRSLQLYTHMAHNYVSKVIFFSDHSALGDFYGEHESDYDSVVERMIGLTAPEMVNIPNITSQATQKMATLPVSLKENGKWFETILALEQQLCQIIQMEIAKASEGTKQLIGDIANKSEMRQYKLKQRLRK